MKYFNKKYKLFIFIYAGLTIIYASISLNSSLNKIYSHVIPLLFGIFQLLLAFNYYKLKIKTAMNLCICSGIIFMLFALYKALH